MGLSGSGNQLTVSNGAAVINANGWIGVNSGANNNSVLVTGSGSIWTNNGNFYIVTGSGNSLTISNGGAVVVTGGSVVESSAANTTLLVTGSNTVWRNTGVLNLYGTAMQLTISAGGQVFNTAGEVRGGDAVNVAGSGSVWNNSGNLLVGSGSGNSLTITNGGAVLVGGNATLGKLTYLNNSITVAGGSLAVTNAGATGILNVYKGTLAINGGTITANQFYATNGANSVLNIGLAGNGSNGHLTVSGTAQLGGPLTVTNLNGFQPAPWNSFTLLTAQTVNGTFTATNLPALAAGLSWQLTYAPTSVVLRVVAAAGPLSALKFTASPVISGTSLTISATNTGAGTIYLLTSTNVAAPRNTWTPIWTNVLGGNGSFTTNLLNAVNPAWNQQFYLLGNTNNN